MSQPFDLDAAVGTGSGEPFPFTWGGKQFDLPRLLDMSIERQLELIATIDDLDTKATDPTQLLGILRLLVGDSLLAELSAAKPLPALAVMKLIEAWIAHQGGELGKSSASPASSAVTALQSKPTSRSGRARKTS